MRYSYLQACRPGTLADEYNNVIKETGRSFRLKENEVKYFSVIPYAESARDLLDALRELLDAQRKAEAQADKCGSSELPDWRGIIESHKTVAALLDSQAEWRSHDGFMCMRLSNSGFAFGGRDGFTVSWQRPQAKRGEDFDKLHAYVTGDAR